MSVAGISSGQIQAPSVTPPAATAASDNSSSFSDLWDTINPLQHIPIISTLYRSLTDSNISPISNIAGSTLYGGPIGGAIAIVQEGLRHAGQVLSGDTQTAGNSTPSTSAFRPGKQTIALDPVTAQVPQHKMHTSTRDWLTQNLNEVSTDTAANTTAPSMAANAYKNINSTTKSWLYPKSSELTGLAGDNQSLAVSADTANWLNPVVRRAADTQAA